MDWNVLPVDSSTFHTVDVFQELLEHQSIVSALLSTLSCLPETRHTLAVVRLSCMRGCILYGRNSRMRRTRTGRTKEQLECGPMPNVMVALPNTGDALCSTPQSLADAHTRCRAVTLPRRETR